MYWKDKYYELLPKYEMEKIKSELFEKELEELKVRYLSHYYNYIQFAINNLELKKDCCLEPLSFY